MGTHKGHCKGHPPYPGCEKGGENGGRPVKYTDEFIDNMADKLLAWLKKDKGNIWFERFAYENEFNPDLFREWSKKNKRFSGAFEQAKTRQKCLLVEGALVKKFNFNMCQLLLGHEYGIFPKQQTQVSGDSESPLALFLNQTEDKTKELVDESKDC